MANSPKRRAAPTIGEPAFAGRAHRLTTAIRFAMALGIVATATATILDSQSFAAAGLAKRIALPITYIVFALSILYRQRGEPAARLQVPRIWQLLTTMVVIGLILQVLFGGTNVNLNATLQATALLLGAVILVAAGRTAGRWAMSDEEAVLKAIVFTGLLSGIIGLTFMPYAALFVPAVLIALLQIRRGKTGFILKLMTAAAIASWAFRTIFVSIQPVSIALILQIASCLIAIIIFRTHSSYKGLVASSTTIGVLSLLLFLPSEFAYLVGDYAYQDVTLAQRGYETAQVLTLVAQSTERTLFGLGPGGVLNLTLSPDAVTLNAAGRDLSAVDDVHLLTTYFLMKFGLLGLFWLVGLFWFVVALMNRMTKARSVSDFEVSLVLCLLAGIAAGIPAATNFLGNPLPFLAAGILIARFPARREGGNLAGGSTTTGR